MFTGLIEELGTVRSVTSQGASMRLEIECPRITAGARTGDSIAVDGVCLTAESVSAAGFTAYASPETMRLTALGDRRAGSSVNLERALALGDRLGGHLVSGHVDATGEFRSARLVDQSWEIRIRAPREITRLSVRKGSITIDGISLTIVDLSDDEWSAWIIPETWTRTTLSQRRPGDRVNLESDLIGKYVARLMEGSWLGTQQRDATLSKLLEQGGWGDR
jgi:riboflavin synthase